MTNEDLVGLSGHSEWLLRLKEEVLVYNQALSLEERRRIERSLAKKWGIALREE